MSSLRTLPRIAGTWEVALLAPPYEIPGVTGIILVAEGDSRKVRLAVPFGPGERPQALLRTAFTTPSPGTSPGRPRAVAVRDPDLLQLFGPLLTEAGVPGVLQAELPALDALAASLSASMEGPTAPGITGDLGAWRQALETLVRVAPWNRIGDDVRFRFAGGGLDGAVAVVIGNAGELRGLILYPTEADLDRFVHAVVAGRVPDTDSWALHIESARELTPAERKACEKAGLALPGGDHPRLLATEETGGLRALDPAEQQRFRLALEAVLTLCAEKLPVLAAGGAASARHRRGAVVIEVRGAPAEAPEHRLVQFDCAYTAGMATITTAQERVVRPTLMLKLTTKDARKLARDLEPITRVVLRRGALLADGPEGRMGCLAPVSVGCDMLVEGWAHGAEVLLSVCGGGSSRAKVRPEDQVWHRVLRFERDEG